MSRRSVPVGGLVAWSALAISAIVVAWSLPIDDFWLTLASGEAIVGGASVTEHLPFSWTDERNAGLNPQWGAQVVLGGTGSLGVALAVNALLVATGLGVTALRAGARARGIAVAVASLLIMVALAPHLLARAQSFSIALFPIGLLLLDRYRQRSWLPVAFGLVIAVWANLHGAFVIGQVAALAWLVAALVTRQSRTTMALTALAALLAPLLNPAGLDLLAYAYAQPATDVVREISIEWQPAWPWTAVAAPFWAIVALVIAGRVTRRPGAPLAELLLLGALAVLAATGVRHIPWFLLAATPVLASDVQAFLEQRPRLSRALGDLPRGLRGSRGVRTVAVIGLIAVAGQLVRPSLPAGLARLTPDAPVELTDALAPELRDGDRVLNEQVWGGYLAYRFGGRLVTAMDGRLEIRSRETWQGYFDLMHGDADPAARLAQEGVSWALLSGDRATLRSKLEAAGWSVVDESAQGVLMRGPTPTSLSYSVTSTS